MATTADLEYLVPDTLLVPVLLSLEHQCLNITFENLFGVQDVCLIIGNVTPTPYVTLAGEDYAPADPGYFAPGLFCGATVHLPCPPGFYCEGGYECPRACPKGSTCEVGRSIGAGTANYTTCPAGYICPIPTAGSAACSDGAFCPEGAWQPAACPGGFYCEHPNVSRRCPEGSFCPLGSTAPTDCSWIAICREGSEKEDFWPLIVTLVGTAVLVLVLIRAFVYPPFRKPQFVLGALAMCSLLTFVLLCAFLTGPALDIVLPVFLAIALLLFLVVMLWREKTAVVACCGRGGRTPPAPAEPPQPKPLSATERVLMMSARDLLPRHEPLKSSHKATHMSFQTKNLNFYVPTKSGRRQFLHDIDLRIPSRAMVAIMGPSGCGKSTLMNVLSGRAHYGSYTGRVAVNDAADDRGVQGLRNLVGFVPQDDVMHAELTVRENVLFNALLRVPRACAQPVQGLVDTVIDALGLTHVQASLVGSVEKRGISGGQRKRVNIAMELVAQPACIMLDEPTSGLDSSTAHAVVVELRSLVTATECTAMAVIHQPRWETLLLFDQLILLAPGGHLVYAGHTAQVLDYFTGLGFAVPPNSNPADALMDVIAEAAKQSEALPEGAAPPADLATTEGLVALWRAKGAPMGARDADGAAARPPDRRRTMHSAQAAVVFFVRATVQLQRRLMNTVVTYSLTLIGVVLLCAAFDKGRASDFQITASLTLLLLGLLSGIAALRIFGQERDVTHREAAAGVKLVPFFVGKAVAAVAEQVGGALAYTASFLLFSSTRVAFWEMYVTVLPFVSACYGLMYTPSFLLGTAKAQLCAIILAFVMYLFAGADPPFVTFWGVWPTQVVMICDPMGWTFRHLLTADVRQQSLYLRQYSAKSYRDRGYYMTLDDFLPDTRWDSGFVDNPQPVWLVALCAHVLALAMLLLSQFWVLGGKQMAKRCAARLWCRGGEGRDAGAAAGAAAPDGNGCAAAGDAAGTAANGTEASLDRDPSGVGSTLGKGAAAYGMPWPQSAPDLTAPVLASTPVEHVAAPTWGQAAVYRCPAPNFDRDIVSRKLSFYDDAWEKY